MKHSKPVPSSATLLFEELTPLARLARRQHQEDDPKVVASRRLTEVFKELYNDGCSVSALAKASGLTYHSVFARVKKDENDAK